MLEIFPDRVWLWLSAACYAGAFAYATVAIVRARARSRTVMLVLVAVGLAVQTLGLHQRGMEAGGCPLRNTFEVIQFVVWSFTVLFLIVGTAFRISLLGYFTSGLAATMSATSLLMKHWDETVRHPIFGGDPWIEVHASLALFAYGAFGLLALTSLMFLLQTFSLKRKRLSGMFSILPPIVELEKINFRLLLTGLVVLTFSIAVGAVYFSRDPAVLGGGKLLIATGVWAAYMIVLVFRLKRLLVANGLAWACLILFGVALLSLGPINGGLKGATTSSQSAIHPAESTTAR